MTRNRRISLLFVLAAVYDGVLGAVFLLHPAMPYEMAKITPPNHWGYVQFPAALLIVFAVMFLAVAARPVTNRNLIPYGILLKAAYCGVVFYYWLTSGLPFMWKPFAVADLAFAVLFVWAYAALPSRPRP